MLTTQQEVELEQRGTFSSQEFAWQNMFEMLAFASTIIYPRPAQFRYPATISAAAVALAGALYAIFVRARRGHLVHLSQCIDRSAKPRNSRERWFRIASYDASEHELTEVSTAASSP